MRANHKTARRATLPPSPRHTGPPCPADIIGHEHAKTLLQSAILQNRLAHAYLFHGDDRIGKQLRPAVGANAALRDGLGRPPAGRLRRLPGLPQVDARRIRIFWSSNRTRKWPIPKLRLSPFETSNIR